MPDSSESQPSAATTDDPLLFGRYRVERELGRGGMGRVLLAFDTKLRIHVAVKLVPDQLMADAEAADDLRREVLRGIALSHPAIVRTHTFEQDETGAAIVMEYIDGLTFTEWKTQQPGHCFDCEQLLPWLGPLCEVLDYAHREARIVHRDLKPRNIMISQEGKLKVADFGIAATLTDSHSRLTGHANMSGTPAYMSPQQARGKKPSHLDDVYSLGATIYDLIAGKPPFFRGSGDTILLQVVGESAPTMAERREELFISGKAPIPEHWEQTIAACLAKDPAERPQSCGEVLARLLTPTPAPEPVPAPQPLKPTKVVAPEPVKKPIGRVTAPREPVPGPSSVSRPRRGKWLALAAALVVAAAIATALHFGKRTNSEETNTAAENSSHPRSAISPSTATKEKPFVNSLGMKFVPVPGTHVLFCIHETRRQDYAAYAAAVDGVDADWKNRRWDGYPVGASENEPVVGVNWSDSTGFCEWLSRKEGKAYRLPTDREWSFAVGIGDRETSAADSTPQALNGKLVDAYPWGTTWPPPKGAGNFADLSYHEKFPGSKYLDGYSDGFPTTAPVMSFAPNRLGIYDLEGNVRQWCEDWSNERKVERVLRGGSWRESAPFGLISSSRNFLRPESRGGTSDLGFRCVIDLAPEEAARGAARGIAAVAANSDAVTPTAATATPAPATPTPAATSALTPKPLSEIDKWLAQVEAIYQPKWQSEVVAPYESGLDELKKNTLSALDTQIANASRVANLNDALAFRNDRQRIESDQGVPNDDSDNPPVALKTLRTHWRTQSARLETDRRQHAQSVFGQYDQILATNQAALTQRQRLDEALQLQQRRDALKKEWFAPPPKPGSPAAATKERPFVNSLGMKFVPVPITGGPTNGQPVLFSIWETRVQDYEAFVKETKRVWRKPDFDQAPTHPSVFVSSDDAQAFCAWLTKREYLAQRLAPDETYRLPNDAEWSCAVEIGGVESTGDSRTISRELPRYSWGEQWPPPARAGNFAGEEQPGNHIAGFKDPFIYTAPVGSFAPNSRGLHDLSGNVAEICEDSSKTPTTPVVRGGDWAEYHADVLLSRVRMPYDRATARVGFRCVLVSTAQKRSVTEAATTASPTPRPASTSGTRAEAAPGSAAGMVGQAPRLPAATPLASGTLALQKATKDAPFVNSLGMKFVPVPGTKVLFCIHETRRQDYAAFANELGGLNKAWIKAVWHGVPCGNENDHPVVCVSWPDAQAFCAWLSKKEGKTYRLPTDREWSYAVGIGPDERRTKDTTPDQLKEIPNKFSWGSGDYPPKTKDWVGNFADTTFKAQCIDAPFAILEDYTDGFATTAPVMSFKPNKLGVYDMGGNVQEWCEDWFSAAKNERLVRGCGFQQSQRGDLLASYRWHWDPEIHGHYTGFRCVVELPEP